jgi:hypothetical protein
MKLWFNIEELWTLLYHRGACGLIFPSIPHLPQVGVASLWPLAAVEGAKTYNIIWIRSAMSVKRVGCLNHSLQHDTSLKPSDSTRTATGTEKTSIDQHPYDHEPQLKVLQHIIYICTAKIWSGWGAPIITLTHPSGEPSKSPTTLTVTVRSSIYQVGVASLWPTHNRSRWPRGCQFFKWSQNWFWVIKPTLIGPNMISWKFGSI